MARFLLCALLAALAFVCTNGLLGLNLALMQQAVPLSPLTAVHILRSLMGPVDHVKLYDYDPSYLTALQSVGCANVVVTIPNDELIGLSISKTAATAVLGVLAPYVAAGMRFTIAVGNEPLFSAYNGAYKDYVVPALANVQAAVMAKGMGSSVQLTVSFSYDFMSISYPPEAGAFTSDSSDVVTTVARILAQNAWPFYVNVYPYFAFQAQQVSEAYGLLETSATIDGVTYPNLLAAQVAALRAALLRVDPRLTAAALSIVVGETGWPTGGDPTATAARAAAYVGNAVTYSAIQPLYLFEAFDETRKPGASVEGHWGLLSENGTMKYALPSLWTRA